MIKIFTAQVSVLSSSLKTLESSVNEAIAEGYEIIHTSTVAGTGFSKYTSDPMLTIILKKQ